MRIRDFDPKRDVVPFALLALLIAIIIAGQVWDAIGAAVLVFALIMSGVLRRVEWHGKLLLDSLPDRSVFRDGLKALPYDIPTLIVLSVMLPAAALVTALFYQTVWAWIGVAIGSTTGLVALVALVLALRRHT